MKRFNLIMSAAVFAGLAHSQTTQVDCDADSTRPECVKMAAAKAKFRKAIDAATLLDLKANLELAATKAKLSAAEFGVLGSVVKGAPYSAEAITESVQVLGDGNRIHHRTSVLVFRDSEGRVSRQDVDTHQTVIMDPVANASFVIDSEKQRAYQRPLAVAVKWDADKARMEMLSTKLAEMKRANLEGLPKPGTDNSSRTESLGQRMIDGLNVEGTRTTTVIPAEAIGNERPIEITSERWFSPDLKIELMTERNDPRSSDVTYRLTNVRRGEPDPAVFQVPAGFTVESSPVPKKPAATLSK